MEIYGPEKLKNFSLSERFTRRIYDREDDEEEGERKIPATALALSRESSWNIFSCCPTRSRLFKPLVSLVVARCVSEPLTEEREKKEVRKNLEKVEEVDEEFRESRRNENLFCLQEVESQKRLREFRVPLMCAWKAKWVCRCSLCLQRKLKRRKKEGEKSSSENSEKLWKTSEKRQRQKEFFFVKRKLRKLKEKFWELNWTAKRRKNGKFKNTLGELRHLLETFVHVLELEMAEVDNLEGGSGSGGIFTKISRIFYQNGDLRWVLSLREVV